jgi:hypothetical protein
VADISFLKDTVRRAVLSDIVEVARYHARRGTNGGWFGVPRQVFCFVDFLGAVSYNNDPLRRESGASTRKAVRFIDEFFPRCYKPFSNLIVAMWRHGTVHNFIPFSYYAMKGNRKVTVKWTSNNSNAQHNRAVNLGIFDSEYDTNTVCLSVNTCQLADDLLYALDALITRMEKNSSFRRGCLRRLQRSLETRSYKTIRLGNAGKNTIRDQIFRASTSSKGILRGDQVEWYKLT